MNIKFGFAICALASIVAFVSTAGQSADTNYKDAAAERQMSAPPMKMPSTTPNRSIYLNGVDISSARNQDLRNVQVKVADNGDLYISAPQYQVTEEETFMPLSSYSGRSGAPTHKPPQELNSNNIPKTAKVAPEADAPAAPAGATPSAPASATPSAPASASPPKSGG